MKKLLVGVLMVAGLIVPLVVLAQDPGSGPSVLISDVAVSHRVSPVNTDTVAFTVQATRGAGGGVGSTLVIKVNGAIVGTTYIPPTVSVVENISHTTFHNKKHKVSAQLFIGSNFAPSAEDEQMGYCPNP